MRLEIPLFENLGAEVKSQIRTWLSDRPNCYYMYLPAPLGLCFFNWRRCYCCKFLWKLLLCCQCLPRRPR